MNNILIIFLITFPLYLSSQLKSNSCYEDDLYDTECELNAKEYYYYVNLLNNQNQSKNKNVFTHELDSVYNYKILNGMLQPVSKGYYLFDKDKDIVFSWRNNIELEAWESNSYTVYHYDGNLLKEQTYNLWDGNFSNLGEQNPEIRRRYFYNKQNQLQSSWIQGQFNIISNNLSSYDTLIYNTDNKLTQRKFYFLDYVDNKLKLEVEYQYNHNEKGLLESIVHLDNDDEYGWFVRDSVFMIYDEEDKLKIEEFYARGPSEIEMSYGLQKIYYYNEDGSINEVANNKGNFQALGHWSVMELERYKYYAYGSLKNYSSYLVNDPYAYFTEQLYESKYEHDGNISKDKVRHPRTRFSGFFDGSHYFENHMILREEHYDGGTTFNPRELEYILEYYYSEIMTSTSDDVSQDMIRVYPNPSSDFIFVDGLDGIENLEFSLINMSGQKVLSQQVYNNKKVDVNHLPSGIYIYAINYKKGLATGKLMLY